MDVEANESADLPVAGVSAVVVNYNAGLLLSASVGALFDAGADEVIVIDNASSDHSLDVCRDQFEAQFDSGALSLVQTGANLGYGVAANQGVERARSQYVAICNPDCLVSPATLRLLVRFLEDHREVGIVGPRILDERGHVYPSPRRFPSLLVSAIHATIGQIYSNNPVSRYYRSVDSECVSSEMWISGAFMLMERSTYQDLGGFDEDYFMFMEDVDLCLKVIRASLKVGFEVRATVEHRQGASSRSRPYFVSLAHHRSLWIYANKSLKGKQRVMLPLVGLGICARFGLSFAKITIRKLLATR